MYVGERVVGAAQFQLGDFADLTIRTESVAQNDIFQDVCNHDSAVDFFLETALSGTVEAFEYLGTSFDSLPRISYEQLDESGTAGAGYNPWYDTIAVSSSVKNARQVPLSAYIGHELIHREDYRDIGVIDWDKEARTGHIEEAETQLAALHTEMNADPLMQDEWQRYRLNQLNNRVDSYAFAVLAQELGGDVGKHIKQSRNDYGTGHPAERKHVLEELGDYLQAESEKTGVKPFPIRDVGEGVPHAWSVYAAGLIDDDDAVEQYLNRANGAYGNSEFYGVGAGNGIRSAIRNAIDAYHDATGRPEEKMQYLLTDYREHLHRKHSEPLCD